MKTNGLFGFGKTVVKALVVLSVALLALPGCKEKEEVKYPVVMEIIGEISNELLDEVCQVQGLGDYQVYQWGDRHVIFDVPEDVERFTRDLLTQAPNVTVKQYTTPFYVFDRAKCADGQTEGKWEHKIFTANLVPDMNMQQEYLNYHKKQSKDFPEVGEGFCRAEFQQVLLYRNGRQLMLVISIPAGKDYETLNARTVDNNPKVGEWNTLMAKYQEGIEGTSPGEVWVAFEPMTLEPETPAETEE